MIRDLHEKLQKKEISAKELTGDYLSKIKKADSKIEAFLSVFEEKALRQAQEVDKKIKSGKKITLLEGIPWACKDNILVEDERMACGSKILESYRAVYDAHVVERLKKWGAILLGKTNLDEFAMGSSTESSTFKRTKNPFDLERVPGGSSGGSAAAVAASECVFALGSDTGGSIRQPAAFCSVVGLKPTYGRVSRYGLCALASSFDQIGPITKTIEDSALVFGAIGGFDERDSTSLPEAMPDLTALFYPGIRDLKIGVPLEYYEAGVDEEVKEKVKAGIKKMEELGAKVDEVSLPHSKYALSCYYIIMPAEASANLARYDGVRYGKSVKAEGGSLRDAYFETRAKGFGPEVKRRIMLGTYTLSAGYYEAYYKKALKVRTKVIEDFKSAFEKFDLLITPTTPNVAFKFGERSDPLAMYMSDILTVPINIAGLPAISLPCGFVKNMPVGLQIIGNYYHEKKLLEAAYAYEVNTEWHKREP